MDEQEELTLLFEAMPAPSGAQWRIDNFFYKEGRHGLLYRWNGSDWVKSDAETRKVKQRKHEL